MPCGIIHQIVWGTSVNLLALILKTINLFLPCKLIFWKATKVGSPPSFPKLISQLRGIPQPQYFVPSLSEPHWTYLWKHYIYHKKDTKVGSQILATKFGFVPDCVLYRVTWIKVAILILLHLVENLLKHLLIVKVPPENLTLEALLVALALFVITLSHLQNTVWHRYNSLRPSDAYMRR